jgi:dihydrofolate reductase
MHDMNRLTSFHFISLDGYYADPRADTSWHPRDEAGSAYAVERMQSGNTLLFGRVTYEFMASFWPTPTAIEHLPELAERMNRADKIVFSRTLKKADWRGTRLIADDAVDSVRRLKETSERDMTLLGSGSLLKQLAEHALIDEFQFMVDPIALGAGRSIFSGIDHRLALKLKNTRAFPSGAVVLSYTPC